MENSIALTVQTLGEWRHIHRFIGRQCYACFRCNKTAEYKLYLNMQDLDGELVRVRSKYAWTPQEYLCLCDEPELMTGTTLKPNRVIKNFWGRED